jgi:hypothetical protein
MTHEGSPTSHGHNSLTVRSYVTFHILLEMNDMYYPYIIVFPANISKLIPLSIKQTWFLYPNLGSPTSHGHKSLTVRSYVTFHIPLEMESHVLSLYNSITFKYIKTHTIIHQTNLGPLPKPLCYQNSLLDFLQGLTSITKG